MKWEIVPDAKEEMFRVAYKGGRGGHRGSSAPSSPSQPNQLNYITHGPREMAARDGGSARRRKVSPTGSPAPTSSLDRSHMTPDRKFLPSGPGSVQDGSPLPRPRKGLSGSGVFRDPDNLPRSPPTLSSSYAQEDGAPFVTPAPHKVHPRLAPPSTAQRPSQHMPTSSPAPFWKYADINTTPYKQDHFDMSPSKPLGLPSSSSPPAPAADRSPVASPTRSGRAQTQETTTIIAEEDEEEEEGGFDLTKYVSFYSLAQQKTNGSPQGFPKHQLVPCSHCYGRICTEGEVECPELHESTLSFPSYALKPTKKRRALRTW